MPRFRYTFAENATSAKNGASVNVYLPGTTTPIPDTIFADATSAATLANPFTVTSTKVSFFLSVNRPVKVVITSPQGQVHAADSTAPSVSFPIISTMKGPGGATVEWVPDS